MISTSMVITVCVCVCVCLSVYLSAESVPCCVSCKTKTLLTLKSSSNVLLLKIPHKNIYLVCSSCISNRREHIQRPLLWTAAWATFVTNQRVPTAIQDYRVVSGIFESVTHSWLTKWPVKAGIRDTKLWYINRWNFLQAYTAN